MAAMVIAIGLSHCFVLRNSEHWCVHFVHEGAVVRGLLKKGLLTESMLEMLGQEPTSAPEKY